MKILKIALSASFVLLLLFSSCNGLFELSEVREEGTFDFPRVVTSSEYYDDGMLKIEKGILGPGAEYMIYLPPFWQSLPEENRKLVIYSHGYVPQGSDPVPIEDYSDAVSYFVQAGYAIAFSSYAETGWAVKDGAIRTRQLRGYFVENIGTADKIYLYGVSEGALIALKLAEQNPGLFSGILAFAGPIGGAKLQFEYIVNTRLVFDYFFKDAVKAAAVGGVLQAQSLAYSFGYDLTFSGSDKSVMEAIADPNNPDYINPKVFIEEMAPLFTGVTDPEKSLLRSVKIDGEYLFSYTEEEILYALLTALWYNIYGSEDILERTHGRIPIDNTESVYSCALVNPPVSLDESVERFESAPNAEKYLEHWYKPDGDLLIPVVSLHILRDPAVPYIHETTYESEMLTQMPPIDGFGHTSLYEFSGGVPVPADPDETIARIIDAFTTLVLLVEPPL